MHLSGYEHTVKQYPYRTATVLKRILECPFHRDDMVARFREELAAKCGMPHDNHECYRIEYSDGTVFYVQFSDWKMYIGLEIDERHW